MAPMSSMRTSKRPTPAEDAERFKQTQQQMKSDAAARRAAADAAPKTKRGRRAPAQSGR